MQDIIAQRVEAVRQWLNVQQLDAIIIPHEDEFLGEYVPAHNERLHWLTGFTGSAGAAVITHDKAAIFVDGRYTVQVTNEVPNDLFEYRHLVTEPVLEWVKECVGKQAKVAIDPRMHSGAWLNQAQSKLAASHQLVILSENPVDTLWQERPQPIISTMRLMPESSVGQSSESKRQTIANQLVKESIDSAVLTSLDSIAWILNIRGGDVSRLPVLLSHAIIHNDATLEFFIESSRLAQGFVEHVGPGVSVFEPSELECRLNRLEHKRVLLDANNSNAWFSLTLQNAGAEIIAQPDPCQLPKAAKNATEVSGMKACHIRDGAAMTKFLCWLDGEVAAGRFHNEAVISDTLHAFRQQDSSLMDLSFDTISAAGTNAAMCHYNHENQPAPGKLPNHSLYLVDSGGQYLDGTTDITRTVAIGQPTQEMINQFTLVLKGHIALAKARFPKGTTGPQLDALARQFLWAEGFDYDHGTGHGVGHFLNVHEGPQSISKRQNTVALMPGMVLSNEPGYYRADGFGIRIENLELVVEHETQGDFSVLGFESLTRCPIDKRNINVDMLTNAELEWLNDYHQKVWNDVSPLVAGQDKTWLQQATSPLHHE
ncbi:aminopeptidase P family protein [Vibrio olivae]|uniref:Aminopeptidase P family protein n=1 Tax=Vibrio olivae TaxID=1243002 RepID=A0ABV5HSS6_9VIBR